ncbi:hypothetical protein D910_06810 [Dendroctonus ponderosae]
MWKFLMHPLNCVVVFCKTTLEDGAIEDAQDSPGWATPCCSRWVQEGGILLVGLPIRHVEDDAVRLASLEVQAEVEVLPELATRRVELQSAAWIGAESLAALLEVFHGRISNDLSVVFAKFFTLPFTVRSAMQPWKGRSEPTVPASGLTVFGSPPTYM